MKKILFVTNKLVFGGVSSALLDLVDALDKTKYDIDVFVYDDGFKLEQEFKSRGINVINSYSCLEEGRRVHNFILRKRIDYSRHHKAKNLLKISLKDKYDLIVGYQLTNDFILALLYCKGKKIRYIHGDAQLNDWLRNILDEEKLQFNSYDRFICVSKLAKRSFNNLYGFEDKTSVLYNPINNIRITDLSNELIPETLPNKYICSVGRLTPEKGFERLIKIHKQLIEEGYDHNLVIIGDGSEREQIEKTIKQLNVSDTVYLLGYKSNPYPYIKNSLFTVIPSYTEGLPVIAMESICLGVPLVTSFPSASEVFADECCGIMTQVDDESLKVGIKKMLADESFYKKACEGTTKRSQAFKIDKMIGDVEKVFNKVMGE